MGRGHNHSLLKAIQILWSSTETEKSKRPM